ncbi:MAG: hypothetical protein ICV73_03140 [Acetobacteraceae bacterium]|nr:hypothetical protein [Acetobacteraceae bacterium]
MDGDDRRADGAARRVKELLGAAPDARELEVVYGRGRRAPGQVAVLTRSVLQILYELGSQIELPEADVRRGETPATEVGAEGLRGRLVAVRHGGRPPSDAYAAVEYRGRWFWIDAGDYRSKAVFAFAHILEILAESGQSQPTPVVTIPAQ